MRGTLIAPQSKTEAIQSRWVSLEAYFRMEEKALNKHEYHDGIILKGYFFIDGKAPPQYKPLFNLKYSNT
jgi:hypothetical protein